VGTLDVSFNGLDAEAYERVMKGAKYKNVMNNIMYTQSAIRRRGAATRLQVNFVVDGANAQREEAVKAFWRTRGIRHFRVQRIHDRAGAVNLDGRAPLDPPGLRRGSCAVFEVVTFVTWDGKVLYCCHDVPRIHVIGNIREDPWEALQARKREIIRGGAWPGMCRACTDPLRHDIRREIDETIHGEIRRMLFDGVRARLRPSRQEAGV
jgi:hypothetical protein